MHFIFSKNRFRRRAVGTVGNQFLVVHRFHGSIYADLPTNSAEDPENEN
jgi:hypothetical protein